MIYGVTQSFHGHDYKWIFDGETLKKEIGHEPEDQTSEDILFPIGGSNSSATYFEKLESDEEIKKFLTTTGEPDLEDPMLVDIGEYLMTVSTDSNSCTKEYIEKYGLKEEQLEQYDDCYGRKEAVLKMAKEMKDKGCTVFDCNNPFYGENRSMRYYEEFCPLYEKVTHKITSY